MVSRVGQQFGHYRLVRLIGQGGFADVYLGEHVHLNTLVAIKVLQMRLIGSNLEQFRTEAQTIASLIHPHIVRVLDFGVEDGVPFLVMDYAPQGTLRQRHLRSFPLPPASIVSYVSQIAPALQYAHDRKLIHRDIKPENMLLGHDDNVLLSDFGLVVVMQSTNSQSTKEMAGTIPYMAPEQINGKPRPASDQYALGIVVYEWLSGTRPFSGSFVEIATQHIMTSPPPLCGRIAGISPAIEQVVFTALAKEPQQRFANVQAFATALEQASQGVQLSPSALLSSNTLQDASSTLVKSPSITPFPQDASSTFVKPPPAAVWQTPPHQPLLSTYVNTQSGGASPSLRPIVPPPPGQGGQSSIREYPPRGISQSPSGPKNKGYLIVIAVLVLLLVGAGILEVAQLVKGSPTSGPGPTQPTALLGQH